MGLPGHELFGSLAESSAGQGSRPGEVAVSGRRPVRGGPDVGVRERGARQLSRQVVWQRINHGVIMHARSGHTHYKLSSARNAA